MTILDQILKASANPQPINDPLKHPFTIFSQPIISTLKPDPENTLTPFTPIHPLTGFHLSQSDTHLIESNSKLFKNLKRKLKSPLSFTSSSFLEMLNPFLEKIGDLKFEGLVIEYDGDKNSEGYSCKLIEKFGSFIGRDVMVLVIEGCVLLGHWQILKTLIVTNLIVDHTVRSGLICKLVSKGRYDLICLCLRCFSDLEASDLGRILKCFLSPSKDGERRLCMDVVRNDWESEANGVIDKVSEKKIKEKKLKVAKEAALLLMIAYDEFSTWELCLHFVLSSSNVDEVVFSSALGKLSAEEMLRLIRYLGKWLRKYERFPQVGPCPEGRSVLKLELCQWVPKLEDVVKAFGLVVDEHYSSLALHSEFHEELKAVDGVVSSLVSEGRLCCSIANLIKILEPEVEGA